MINQFQNFQSILLHLKFWNLHLSNDQKQKKVEVLKKYEHDSLKAIFIWNFDDSVISLLPPGDVPYGEAEDQSVYSGSLSDNIAKEASGGESATAQDMDGRRKVISPQRVDDPL